MIIDEILYLLTHDWLTKSRACSKLVVKNKKEIIIKKGFIKVFLIFMHSKIQRIWIGVLKHSKK